jgi:signal transduction histidine kinase
MVILLGSTFVVFVVSLVVTYLLVSSEIQSVREHIKSFEATLKEREKFSIKSVVENLINDIRYENSIKNEKIKHRVKNQSIIAYNIARSVALQNRNKSPSEVIKTIKNIIRSATRADDGIDYFIFNHRGTILLDTKNKENEGKNFIDFKDINEKSFIREILETDGFVEYFWYRPNDSKIAKKITYSKQIPSLNIVIGSRVAIESNYAIGMKIANKIKEKSFSENEFIFIYNIENLHNLKKFSRLVLEKNISTGKNEIEAISQILIGSDYRAGLFYRYDNKLIYSTFLPDIKTLISAGVYLNSIDKMIEDKTLKANKKLNRKIVSLVFTMIVVASIFFLLSYIVSKKIERLFRDYRLKIAHGQQLLIQKSKMASMGEMIGNIAHQWRQPLSQLSGLFFDIESAYDYKELDKKYLTKISDEANDLIEYMSKTIDDFREFYNPNTKKERFNLLHTIESALKIIGSSLEFHKIRVSLHVKSSLHVDGFSNELSQVILNILSNSRDIALFRDTKEPKIKIYCTLKNGKISLHVEDNCGGIGEKNIEKIFEPYFTTKYDYGTGIGLYMCKVIVEHKMGGKIFATNIKNGSKFTIEGLHV